MTGSALPAHGTAPSLLDKPDNRQLTRFLRATHGVCTTHNDVATTSLIENWIDEAERRSWFLFESTRPIR